MGEAMLDSRHEEDGSEGSDDAMEGVVEQRVLVVIGQSQLGHFLGREVHGSSDHSGECSLLMNVGWSLARLLLFCGALCVVCCVEEKKEKEKQTAPMRVFILDRGGRKK